MAGDALRIAATPPRGSGRGSPGGDRDGLPGIGLGDEKKRGDGRRPACRRRTCRRQRWRPPDRHRIGHRPRGGNTRTRAHVRGRRTDGSNQKSMQLATDQKTPEIEIGMDSGTGRLGDAHMMQMSAHDVGTHEGQQPIRNCHVRLPTDATTYPARPANLTNYLTWQDMSV